MEFFGPFVALSLGLPLAFLGVVVLAVVAIVSGRRDEPDPEGQRAHTLYVSAVSLIALFALVFSGYAALNAVLTAVIEDDGTTGVFEGRSDSSEDFFSEEFFDEDGPFAGDGPFGEEGEVLEPIFPGDEDVLTVEGNDDAEWRTAVQAGIVALVAAGIYLFHRRRLDAIQRASEGREGGGWRVFQGFLYAVCFVAMLTALVAAGIAGNGLFRILAPGVTDGFARARDERMAGLVQLLATGALAAASVLLFRWHWNAAATLEGRAPAPAAEGPESAPPDAEPSAPV